MGLFCRQWLAFRHNLCGSHLQSQCELYHVRSLTSSRFYSLGCWEEKTTRSKSDEFQANHVRWWCWTLVINLIGQLSRDVIGRLSVMSLARFDLSIVRVEPVVCCHKNIVDWTQTSDRKWWCQQLRCWTLYLQTKNQIDWELCDTYYVFYRPLSTTYCIKLAYYM